jgi:hypothetical protein
MHTRSTSLERAVVGKKWRRERKPSPSMRPCNNVDQAAYCARPELGVLKELVVQIRFDWLGAISLFTLP